MAKWSYEAIRTKEGVKAFVVVQNGSDVTNRHPLPHIAKHSVSGFSFGRGCAGSGDLAFSILVHWFMSYKYSHEEARAEAEKHYRRFMSTFIVVESKHISISDQVIEEWWVEQEEAREKALEGARP